MASAILFESRTTILATVQHNWQCIPWLYIASTKEFHVKGYANVSKQDGRRVSVHSYTRHLSCFVFEYGEGRFKCLLRSDWVIAQIVRLNRLENRTRCNSKLSDFIGPEHSTNMPHFTIGRRTGQSAGSARANRIV